MQTIKDKVKRHLEGAFKGTKVRETETGFRFNIDQLDQSDLASLDMLPANVDILIKRSGTGLVIIIS